MPEPASHAFRSQGTTSANLQVKLVSRLRRMWIRYLEILTELAVDGVRMFAFKIENCEVCSFYVPALNTRPGPG
eukprot:scaffold258319_cov44-Prasinocladus_malaysianus.AAC.1